MQSRRRSSASTCFCVFGLAFLSAVLGTGLAAQAGERISAPRPAEPATQKSAALKLAGSLSALPLSFEPNRGQADAQVKFLARGRGYTVYLTAEGAVVALRAGRGKSAGEKRQTRDSQPGDSPAHEVLRLRLLGANPYSKVRGEDLLPGKVNYFRGNDPAKWQRNIETFAKVRYENVWPGIDLVYYGHQGQLQYDFVVAPGADASRIRIAVEPPAGGSVSLAAKEAAKRTSSVQIAANGDLVIALASGEVRFCKPFLYQWAADGSREVVKGGFALRQRNDVTARSQGEKHKAKDGNYPYEVSFVLGSYDLARTLVIDPFLLYATYLGGTGTDAVRAVAVDASGNIFAAGGTTSEEFPLLGAVDPGLSANEGFVTKFTADGSTLVFSTYLGGSGDDEVFGLALDSSGNPVLTGRTTSTNFPTQDAFQNTYGGGASDAFVTMLLSDGSDLVYSSYLGGSGEDKGAAIALDSFGGGNAFVAGTTSSQNDFPGLIPGIQEAYGGGDSDGFVAHVFESDSIGFLNFSTFLGGSDVDSADGIAVDSSMNLYVTGSTSSPNFPVTTSALQTTFGGVQDAFVTKINMDGQFLEYSSYLGGTNHDAGRGVAVDSSTDAYVTGETMSADFPTVPGSFDTSCGADGLCESGTLDAFVSKVDSTGTSLVYSTFLGGSGFDRGMAVAVDAGGSAHVVGDTGSTLNFPLASPFQSSPGGAGDGFVTKLSPDGSTLDFSTFLGGSNSDSAFSLALNQSGDVYVGGATASSNFPVTIDAFEPDFPGGTASGFIARYVDAIGPVASLTPTFLEFPQTVVGVTTNAQSITLSNTGDLPMTVVDVTTTDADFSATHDCGGSLAAEASCQIQVTYTPTAIQFDAAELQITTNAPGSPHGVSLFGQGISAGVGSPSPASLDFGQVEIGATSAPLTVTFTNDGTGPLGILGIFTSGGAFAQSNDCPSSLPAGEFCSIQVTFTPQFAGLASDALEIHHDGAGSPAQVPLSGTGVGPGVSLSQTFISFNKQRVGTVSAPFEVTLLNSGNEPLEISSIVAAAEFAVTENCPQAPATLAPSTSCALTITFAPTAPGLREGTITITSNAASSPDVITLQGFGSTGLLVTPLGEQSPEALVQALVGAGVTVSNVQYRGTPLSSGFFTGGANIIGFEDGIILSSGQAGDVVGPNISDSTTTDLELLGDADLDGLIPGFSTLDATVLEFDFVPEDSVLTFQYVFTSEEYNEFVNSTFNDVFGFFVNGVNAALLPGTETAVSINNVNGGNPFGTNPSNPDFYRNNDLSDGGGEINTEMDGLTVVLTVQAQVNPGVTNHIKLAVADAGDSDLDSNVFLRGGSLSSSDILLTPLGLAFGDVMIGATSDPRTVTVTNAGGTAVTFNTVSLAGASPGDFAIVANTCVGATLSLNQTCQVTVTFAPQSAGLRLADLVLTSTSATSPHTAPLSGNGFGAGLLASPTSVHFPGNPLDLDCPSKEVTLTNSGDTTLTVLSLNVTANFSVTHNCPTSLAVGESCVASIKFLPDVVGLKQGSLTVVTEPATAVVVALSGNGTPPCGLQTNGLRRAVVKGTNAAQFTIADKSPSCSPVPIQLSCALENPAACEFSPVVIPPSGSSNLRVLNLRNVAGDRLNFTVQAVSEFRTAAVAVSVVFLSFDFTAYPQSATVAAGGTAEYAVSLRPVNGLTGTVRLSCSGAPRGATCSVEPSQVTLDGLNIANVKVRVRTTGRAMTPPLSERPSVPPFSAPWLATAILLAGLVAAWMALRRRQARLALASVLAAVLLWAACGGGGTLNLSSGGTPAGTSTLTVTGSYTIPPDEANPEGGTLENSTELSLTVN